jgi:hypothetical protein
MQLPSPPIMSAATLGMSEQVINFLNNRLEKMLCIQEVKSQHQHQHHHVDIHSRTIPNSQQERERKMLILYRDDMPGAYIPCESGDIPRIVELELPAIRRRDMKLLMRYPEPRRTATWIRMSFVADDDYIASSGVLCKAYADALQPWVNKLDRKASKSTPSKPTTPLLGPDDFSAVLEKQIEGYVPEFSWNGKEGTESRTITRGVRARTEALTFSSTNRKRNLRQLKHYKKMGDLIYPEGDPDKRSTFAKWMADDPLFLILPRETRSLLSARMLTNPAESVIETEDAGFPGVSIEKIGKKGKKGKKRQRGRSTDPRLSPTPGGATGAAATGPTDAEFLAQLEEDWAAVGGFGTMDGNKDQGDAQPEASAKGKERQKDRSDSCNRDPRLLQRYTLLPDQTPAQFLASVEANVAAVEDLKSIDWDAGKQSDMGKEASDKALRAKQVLMRRIIDDNMAITGRIAFLERQVIEEKAQTASVKRRLSEERAKTTTGDRNADATTQDAAADSAGGPFSAGSAPLQDGLSQAQRAERNVTVAQAVNARIASLERELHDEKSKTASVNRRLSEERARTMTEDRNADATTQDAAADIVTVAPEKKAGPISNAEKQGDTPEEASDNDAKQEHLKKIRDRTKAVNDRITSLERELDEVTAKTTSKKRKSKKRKSKKSKSNEKTDQSTTGDCNADTTIQDAAADSAKSPVSAESTPLQTGLPQPQRLEPDVPVTLEKKKPVAGAGRVRRRAE